MTKKPSAKRRKVGSLALKKSEMRFTKEGLEKWINPKKGKKEKKKK